MEKNRRVRQAGFARRSLGLVTLAIFFILAIAPAHAASEIVIAIRYLQAKGESHAHLFLYRDDGKLLRQLTKDDSGQDQDPIFAPDGETIVFTRELRENKLEFWSVEPTGAGLKRLERAPDWYSAAKTSPYFVWPEQTAGEDTSSAPYGERSPHFLTPDDSLELVLHEVKEDEEDTMNQPGHGKHYLLRDLKSGDQVEFAKLPGFEGAVELLKLNGREDRFLIEPPLRLAFFGVHLNSTDGDTDYALDLTGRRLVRLSPNWAAPFPLPGESAFLTMNYVRYVPIPGTKKTANCGYVERWDASLKKLRFAGEGAAAISYGASMYRAEKTPTTITIRKSGE
jgi:hypothetical protein